jgi:hypothetical protein
MQVEIEEGFTVFVACLVLGTLRAIEAGALSPDIGIWSLAAPRALNSLLAAGNVPPEIIDVLRQGDELSMIKDFQGVEAFEKVLQSHISRIEAVLAENPDDIWRATWKR